MPRPRRDELIARYNFAIDHFQIEALDALDRGDSVLVAAPTGSGKTLVAEYAIESARRQGKRAFIRLQSRHFLIKSSMIS